MSIEVMKQALEVLETLARYENPETRIQVRKPKDGGPIVTMYPHKVASDAAAALRTAIEQVDKQEPVCDKDPRGCWSVRCQLEKKCKNTPPAAPRQEQYDQTALELCEECGWKALIPGDGCLVCARQKAPREWVELTDDEARALVNRATFGDRTNWQALVYMVDAKLKDKNA